MRSLILLDVKFTQLVSSTLGAVVAGIATDPSTDSLYAIAENSGPDGTTELSVFVVNDEQLPEPIAFWTTQAVPTLQDPNGSSIVSFKYLPESDSLCVVLANGDIEQVFEPGSGEGVEKRRENVGSVDAGIKSAAWSPDEELLVLITGDDKLIEMTKDFEVLSEGPLRSADFGEDAPVNVGWGDKSTQFRGSVGKSAASTSTPTPSTPQSSPDDDGLPRISWRGDSAFFALSSLDCLSAKDEAKRRILRVFSRVAALSSTSEPTSGLEHGLSWQPSGSIIASTQKVVKADGTVDSHHVVFFERNGLRRYDFVLREPTGSKSVVRELSWNSDSSLLAVWIERTGEMGGHAVQLWHRNNYCWYLKQEIVPRLSGQAALTGLLWHPEKALELYLATTSGIESYSISWDTFASTRPPPNDDGTVAVVDGSTLKLTPFRLENIPPPMSSMILPSSRLSWTPVHVSFSSTSATLIELYSDGFVETWAWPLVPAVSGKAREEIKPPTLVRSSHAFEGESLGLEGYARQCACVGEGSDLVIAVLRSSRTGHSVVLVDSTGATSNVELNGGAIRLVAGVDSFIIESDDGTILEVPASMSGDDIALPSEDLPSLPERCTVIRHTQLPSTRVVIGLADSGRLYAGSRLLANDSTSFTCTPDFLIFTTFSHEAKFIPLFNLEPTYAARQVVIAHTESLKRQKEETDAPIKRAVERGSRIVTVVPSSTSLVLQMPRGNLETIFPRPLVLRIVRQDLDSIRYRAAFLACRRHRIDLNILYDHNPSLFRSHLDDFVSQIKQVDHLNLFLSGLKNEDVTATMYRPLIAATGKPTSTTNKINEVCDMVRGELEKRDVFHYANTILTAYVRKSPPDYESALKALVELKARDAARAEDAVTYIIFLSDANTLFDLALGMYDFSLVLMIAQHSQKDPREYLPFLRDLQQLDTHRQRFKIDDHLERFDSALKNLALAGAESFDEALEYTKAHELFTTALQAFKDDSTKYKIILSANAEHLVEQRQYSEAGVLFSLGGQPAKAMQAYQKANAWQELFTLALSESKRSASEIKALAVEVAESLRAKRRYVEAGRVLLDYGRDVEAAVGTLVEGTAFAEAIRLTTLYTRRDLVETHVKPGTLEMQSRMLEDIAEVMEQVEKQVERLDELREKRDSNPNQYFCIEDPTSAFDNVEIQPDGASDAGTAFTRYTAAPTTLATTRKSSRTAASRRKGALKRAAGKKGSIFEETYLLVSLKKTFEIKLAELHAEAASLLPILLTLNSTSHRTAAVSLQSGLSALEAFLAAQIVKVWTWREEEWAEEKREAIKEKERGEFVEKGKPEEGTERVERPKLAKGSWRISLLDT